MCSWAMEQTVLDWNLGSVPCEPCDYPNRKDEINYMMTPILTLSVCISVNGGVKRENVSETMYWILSKRWFSCFLFSFIITRKYSLASIWHRQNVIIYSTNLCWATSVCWVLYEEAYVVVLFLKECSVWLTLLSAYVNLLVFRVHTEDYLFLNA